MSLAPIGITTYGRLSHLKETIVALQKNTLAKYSELYVFSDAPKKGDEDAVSRVRRYIHTIDGFSKVFIIEREVNGRVANGRGGLRQLLDKYGKVIFMEEDIVTAPGYLQFMNDALELYESDPLVFSITGYTPIETNIGGDVCLSRRFSGWGYAIWKNRFDQVRSLPEFKSIKNNKILLGQLTSLGQDIPHMIKMESQGVTNALDIRFCYLCVTKNYVNIYPSQTLVRNIGRDGSGLHSNISNREKNTILNSKVIFNLKPISKLDRNLLTDCELSMKSGFNKEKLSFDVFTIKRLANFIRRKFRSKNY